MGLSWRPWLRNTVVMTQSKDGARAGTDDAPSVPTEGWGVVHELLSAMTREDSVQASFRQFQNELRGTSYESISVDEFLDRFRVNRSVLVRGLDQRRMPDDRDDATEVEATGQSRAVGGVELSDIVRVTLAAQNAFIDRLRVLAHERGVADGLIIELLSYVDGWHSWTVTALICGYEEHVLASLGTNVRFQDEALQRLLAGGLTAVEAAKAAADCGLDNHDSHLVLRVVTEGRSISDVRRALLAAGALSSSRDPVALMYGDVCILAPRLPPRAIPLLVGVSSPVQIDQLAEGFRLATRAADSAKQLGRTGFVTMRDLSICASVAADREVAAMLRRRYIDPLLAFGVAGDVILDTVAEYLRRSRRVVKTAEALFVHANTVRYRLERFEATTGCSLKSATTITEVWWILHAART